jgi:hypothetical protein
MTAGSPDASADAVELGALLVLLHGADAPVATVEVIYRLWRHPERGSAAFLADIEEQKRRARRSQSRPSTRRRCASGALVSEFVSSITAASGLAVTQSLTDRCGGSGTSETVPTATRTIPA